MFPLVIFFIIRVLSTPRSLKIITFKLEDFSTPPYDKYQVVL